MSATQLLASGYDVIVTSYEFVEKSGRKKLDFPDDVEAYANDQHGRIEKPKRPTAALHSDLWLKLGLRWKRVILDKGQRANKRGKKRHDAIKYGISGKAYIILSGTLAHNKWHDFSGYVDFLQGHPFDTHEKFLNAFGTWDNSGHINRPDIAKIRLLQRFLQAILIACPATVLNLRDCKSSHLPFCLLPEEARIVHRHYNEYREVSAIASASHGMDDPDARIMVLSIAVLAQLASLHPLIYEESVNRGTESSWIDQDDDFDEARGQIGEVLGGQTRDDWLQLVKERSNLCKESGRLIKLLELFPKLRKEFPTEKIVIFSQYLKFLDIVAEALRREFGIIAFRYDGSVMVSKRSEVEGAFKSASPDIPLLMTAGAGMWPDLGESC